MFTIKRPTPGQWFNIIELAIVIIVAIALLSKGCGKSAELATDRGTADSVFYWKNKYGEATASLKASEAQFSVQNKVMQQMLDSVAKIYNTQAKRIQELAVIVSHGTTRIQVVPGHSEVDVAPPIVTPHGDTCPPQITAMRDTFANNYYTAKVQLGKDPYLKLTSVDTLTYLWKTVKEGNIFHRRRLLQLDVNHANPDITVTGLTAFRRLDQPKQTSIVLGSDMLYVDQSIHILGGLGVERQTGRVNVGITGGKDFTTAEAFQRVRFAPWYGKAHIKVQLIKF